MLICGFNLEFAAFLSENFRYEMTGIFAKNGRNPHLENCTDKLIFNVKTDEARPPLLCRFTLIFHLNQYEHR
jgi:hypothetical protein